jgi:hypothetical protein
MLKRVIMLVLTIMALIYAQSPYLPGETVLSEHNLSWTDNNEYSSNIFDEIAINQRVVMIFWGGHG